METPSTSVLLHDFLVWASFASMGALVSLIGRNVYEMFRRKEWWRWGAVVLYASFAAEIGILAKLIYRSPAVEPTMDAFVYLTALWGITVGGIQVVLNAGRFYAGTFRREELRKKK